MVGEILAPEQRLLLKLETLAITAPGGTGESSLFSRRMLLLRFRQDQETDARDLFYVTEIRRQHSEDFIRSAQGRLAGSVTCPIGAEM